MLALARAHDAPAFARELARWTATLDPASLERDHQAQRRNRFLHLSDQPDGTRLTGLLDRMAGHRLRIALEATGETPDEDRSPEQARADALLALAEHALTDTGHPPRCRGPPARVPRPDRGHLHPDPHRHRGAGRRRHPGRPDATTAGAHAATAPPQRGHRTDRHRAAGHPGRRHPGPDVARWRGCCATAS